MRVSGGYDDSVSLWEFEFVVKFPPIVKGLNNKSLNACSEKCVCARPTLFSTAANFIFLSLFLFLWFSCFDRSYSMSYFHALSR